MRSIIIGSGLMITLLIVLFKLAEMQLFKGHIRMEIIVAVTSLVFFLIGIYYNRKQLPETGEQTPEPRLFIDKKLVTQTDLSKREMEVLQKMSEGLSNQEIAEALFLSESTIKTHVSNILFKLDAKRRTEALKVAREKGLIE